MTPTIVVHGGAGMHLSDRRRRVHLAAMREALRRGLAALDTASDAVIAAVAYMETETDLNAGRGGALDAEGRVTLDAGFMEGARGRFGAVGCVTRTATPVMLAHALSGEGDHGRLIVGPAADRMVEAFGLPRCEPRELITPRALHAASRLGQRPTRASRDADTVGAVAIDAHGRLAAAVSTGGLTGKPPGRVGDSAIVGAGFWAESPLGACVTTGIGEVMLREGTARRCVRLLAGGGGADEAVRRALAETARGKSRPSCGLILLATDGRVAIAHSSPSMAAGFARIGESVVVRARWRAATRAVFR